MGSGQAKATLNRDLASYTYSGSTQEVLHHT